MAAAIEEVAKVLKPALNDDRKKGAKDAEYFKVIANAFSDLYKAFALMTAYGEVNPAIFKRVESELFKELRE